MGRGDRGGEREILLDRAGYSSRLGSVRVLGTGAECCMYICLVVACTMLLGAPTCVTRD